MNSREIDKIIKAGKPVTVTDRFGDQATITFTHRIGRIVYNDSSAFTYADLTIKYTVTAHKLED